MFTRQLESDRFPSLLHSWTVAQLDCFSTGRAVPVLPVPNLRGKQIKGWVHIAIGAEGAAENRQSRTWPWASVHRQRGYKKKRAGHPHTALSLSHLTGHTKPAPAPALQCFSVQCSLVVWLGFGFPVGFGISRGVKRRMAG